jgi:hypothetical protein
MVMRTILGTPLSGFPARPGSVHIVTWHRGLTKSKVKSSCTDNWFPASDKIFEKVTLTQLILPINPTCLLPIPTGNLSYSHQLCDVSYTIIYYHAKR